jgi:hypothetical protein
MQLNTAEAIKDLSGKKILKGKTEEAFTIGSALSNILLDAKEGGKMKLFILAQKCFEEKKVELDGADISIIKQAVEKTDQYNALVSGQILQILENLKETDKK